MISECENFMPDEENWIDLPRSGRLISEFIEDLNLFLPRTNEIFYRPSSRQVIEIGKIKRNGEDKYTGFIEIGSNRFITLCEKHIVPGQRVFKFDKNTGEHVDTVFKKKSISSQLANTILVSELLQENLPCIERIFTVPTPIIQDEILKFPKRGYDRRFNSWLPKDSPEIIENITLDQAKEVIDKILSEFCFKEHEDKINAIAGLLSPFLKGLYPNFNCRNPVFVYIGNRERVGKDYLANLTGLIYEGKAIEESPINSEDENGRSKSNEEELRKKITAALINGQKRMHFANNKGYINNAIFEAIITSKTHRDRLLGQNKIAEIDNELDFTLSGNMGITFTPDLMNRSRFINLFLDIEDANKREFKNPNLHSWVLDNRSLIISSFYTLIKNWYDKGMPKGKIPFTSFPEWAEVCGGIMENAGYESPCKANKSGFIIGGDTETQDVKRLFEICFERFGTDFVTKNEIKLLIISNEEIFQNLDFNSKKDQIKFGNLIKKNLGRVYSDIKLVVEDLNVRGARQKFRFTKSW